MFLGGTVYSHAGNKTIYVAPNSVCSSTNRNANGQTMCSGPVRSGSVCQADSGSPVITRGASCGGPVTQINNGNNGINNSAQKPPRPPQKPVSPPSKPSSPSKPAKPYKPKPRYQTNLFLGLVSYGSCDSGFSFTRATAYLDFLTRFVPVANDATE